MEQKEMEELEREAR